MSDELIWRGNPDLEVLLVPVELLDKLQHNPRKGNVAAIAGMYKQYGQQKPITVAPTENGRFTILAGNHQLEAAKELEWTHIACTKSFLKGEDAVTYALGDNRSHDMGHTDPTVEWDIIHNLDDDYSEVFNSLGWDDFEIATMEPSITSSPYEGPWEPPVMNPNAETGNQAVLQNPSTQTPEDVIRRGPDQNVTSSNASVQFNIVFGTSEEQQRFYSFVRWLSANSEIGGETIGAKIINFVETYWDQS